MSKNLFEAVDRAFEEGRIVLTEEEDLKYSYSNDVIRNYYEEMKADMEDFDSEEDKDKFIDSELANIDHIESSRPLKMIEYPQSGRCYGFDGGKVITYLKDGRKYLWDGEEALEDNLSLPHACELVISDEITDDSEEDVVGFDKERELERLHQNESSKITEEVSEDIQNQWTKLQEIFDGKITEDSLSGGLFYMDMTADEVITASKEASDFVDPNEQYNESPSLGQFINFLKEHPDFVAEGYVTDPFSRSDIRLSIDGVKAPMNDSSKATLEQFIEDCKKASDVVGDPDEFGEYEGNIRAWWD